jgi:hypothetical protein
MPPEGVGVPSSIIRHGLSASHRGARAFLARELGMTELVAGPFRSTGARTGEVGFRHRYGEGRRLLPQTGPYAVVVQLQRLPAGWEERFARLIQRRVRVLGGPAVRAAIGGSLSPTRLPRASSVHR